MALPEQVRKQAEAVDKLYAEISADVDQQGTQSDAGTGVDAARDNPASQRSEPTPEPRQPEQAGGDKTVETIEQKYRTLQGMYNAEVPRLHSANRELHGRIQQLEQLIATMTAQPVVQAPPATKLITEQDVEDYGDSIDVMRRVFREEMASKDAVVEQLTQMVRQMQGSVVPQVQQLSHNQAVSHEQRFWADLQARVPDWQEVNNNQNFQSWLLEVDALTGAPRQTYLDDAQRNMDAQRVANFFTTWKGLTGVAPTAQPLSEPRRASDLERQIAPGKGRSGNSNYAANPKNYSPADIRNFFADVQKGVYKGREDERNRIERDIFAAQQQGRIVTT